MDARKRGRPEAASYNSNGGFKRSKQELESNSTGLGSKSKPCTKFFSTSGCPFGDNCHFLHYVPGGYNAVAQMTNLCPPVAQVSRICKVLVVRADSLGEEIRTRPCFKLWCFCYCQDQCRCFFSWCNHWKRWDPFQTDMPEDNSFYEAVVTQYNADEGRHALVYDINTANETWEWVDLKEIPPEDIRWDGEENGVTLNVGHGGGTTRGNLRTLSQGGRGRGPRTQPRREHLATQNGGGRKFFDEIELFNTDSLVKEVERVFDSNLPDPLELDKAKKLLKEHEQALIAAIARLADASDYESDGEEPYSYELPMPQG